MVRSENVIRQELRRCERLLGAATDDRDRDALYGAVQALSWALRMDAAAPHVLASADA